MSCTSAKKTATHTGGLVPNGFGWRTALGMVTHGSKARALPMPLVVLVVVVLVVVVLVVVVMVMMLVVTFHLMLKWRTQARQ